MHVRDDSIYNAPASEILPLHKPLYMMRTQKGPAGVPVWCDQYQDAARTFGEDTFNKRSPYFSEQAYFLLKTFPSNGAFIMRVADTNARPAEIAIELGLSKDEAEVPQWKRDSNGRFVLNLNGTKIPINSEGEECKAIGEATTVYARALEATAYRDEYFQRSENYVYSNMAPSDRRWDKESYFIGKGRPVFEAAVTSADPVAGKFYFESTDDASQYVPAFNLKKFAAGKTYLVLKGFENGYRVADVSELPALVAGQTIGDQFMSIKESAIKVATDGGATYGDSSDAETSEAYESYRFVRALDASNPYEYTSVSLPSGTSLINGVYYYKVGEVESGAYEPQATIPGYKVAWRARVIGTYDEHTGAYKRERAVGEFRTVDSDNFTWYPMVDIVAENPGVWGQKFGVKLYFDENANTVSKISVKSACTYNIAPVQLVEDDTTPTGIVDGYGQNYCDGVMRPGVVDSNNPDVSLELDKKLKANYTGRYALPIQFTVINKSWDEVGRKLMEAEIKSRSAIETLYGDFRRITDAHGDEVAETFVDALFGKVADDTDVATEDAGYMVNVLSCVDGDKIPHFCSAIVDASDELVSGDSKVIASTVVVPADDVAIYLGGGDDGAKGDADVEKQIRAQIKSALAQTQEYLIDYARCPFNSIIDTGVSYDTKMAYLDLLSVRDSLVVDLATQVTWKDANGIRPDVNGRAYDESMGSALRAYAWLMKEDIVNGTEACRARIWLHAGYRSDHDLDVPCASTLWIALKNAEYLNRTYILREPKGLINNEADVDCWEDISWVAAAEDTKSRCWNEGLNYVQFYNMSNYHYASVRTVYRYETSVLVDSGVVNALAFMKDEARRSWAKFAGVTIPAAMLNKMITDDLTSRYSYLLNGKYSFSVNVYQTDEDVREGYARHIDITLISPATNRVWIATFICKREGYDSTEA